MPLALFASTKKPFASLHRALSAIALLAAVFTPTLRASSEKRLNLLLILSDDHSAPHVGCYGNRDILTPNLDKFAAQGMRFDLALVTSPQCVPSRASVMTGRSPDEFGFNVVENPVHIHDLQATIMH